MAVVAALSMVVCTLSAAQAQRQATARTVDAAERANANTVTLVSGTPGASYFRIASDMSFVLDDGEELRVLSILGKGALQNAVDILLLRGVDLGLVRTDTPDQLKADERVANKRRNLVYIARLFNDEMQVLTTRDVTDVRQLAGRKVNFDVKGTGNSVSGPAIFDRLGIKVEALNLDQPTAIDRLKKGEIDAVVSIAAKPVAVFANLAPDPRLRLIGLPYDDRFAETYFPATLTANDYPNLMEKGAEIETMAVGTVLAAFNWPDGTDRYRRLARFVDAFFTKFDRFLEPSRHPKWKEVNIAATLPGWERFKAAQQWLDRHRAGSEQAPQPATTRPGRR